jgi:hypothetical protein
MCQEPFHPRTQLIDYRILALEDCIEIKTIVQVGDSECTGILQLIENLRISAE